MALPTPPFHPTLNIHNFRALLPPPTLTNPSPNPLLYRSADPSAITPAGIRTLHALSITAIYDLRSTPEIEKQRISRTSFPETDGIARIHAPVFEEQDYSPESLALRYVDYASGEGTTGFVRAYTEILEHGGPAFRQVFGFLRDKQSGGERCLVHCTAGKDRTGILCALVLLLVGASDDYIASEYALTELGLREWREGVVDKLVREMGFAGGREGAKRMVGARKENMLATLEVVRERYGGVEGYLRGKCGLGVEDVRRIRENLRAEKGGML